MAKKYELLRDEAVITLGHILGYELKPVNGSFETTRDVFYAFNLHYEDVALTLSVGDTAGDAVASPTVVLKTGAIIGSGDVISVGTGGKYVVRKGSYNYSVTKTGYETETGTIVVDYNDAIAEVKQAHITLQKLSVVTIAVVDKDAEAIESPTVVIKTGTEVGSGDVVTAGEDGKYKCSIGTFNYSVSKTGYETETGTFAIVVGDLDGTKTVSVVLKAPCIVTITVTDEDENPIDTPTVVIKTGEVEGAGDVVTAEADGTYKVGVGNFNYSISKETYVTLTGTFAILTGDLNNTKTLELVLVLDAE